jgi:PAS domain S-box-containing protein
MSAPSGLDTVWDTNVDGNDGCICEYYRRTPPRQQGWTSVCAILRASRQTGTWFMANAKGPPDLEALPTSPSLAQTLPSDAVLDALKMILLGAPLNEVLTTITRLIEAHSAGMLCSIFLLDEDSLHLRYGVAASLPAAYRAATDGICIGPNVGSCGTAAYLGQPVFVSDIASDPRWVKFRDVALQSGLRAAWSTPILSRDGKVLGTFGIYYREVRQPAPAEIQLIDYASRIAGIAIERDRSQTALTSAFDQIEKSEAQLRHIVDAIPQMIAVLNPDGTILYMNQTMLDYTGLTFEEAKNARDRAFYPEDVARFRGERVKSLSREMPFQHEKRILRKDGHYRWFLIQYNPLLDDQGQVIRWYATGTDIHDRVQAEERTRNENLALREQIDRDSMFEDIVGSSDALNKVLRQVRKVAPSDSTILILGETGTGKELIARAIHKRSSRADHAFIGVNCATIPPSLIASELFGHEKGAFTGATQRRLGRFESANGGTIFLDEVGDLPPEVQIALLRVLQEREIEGGVLICLWFLFFTAISACAVSTLVGRGLPNIAKVKPVRIPKDVFVFNTPVANYEQLPPCHSWGFRRRLGIVACSKEAWLIFPPASGLQHNELLTDRFWQNGLESNIVGVRVLSGSYQRHMLINAGDFAFRLPDIGVSVICNQRSSGVSIVPVVFSYGQLDTSLFVKLESLCISSQRFIRIVGGALRRLGLLTSCHDLKIRCSRERFGSLRLNDGCLRQRMGIGTPALHLKQLAAHNEPLKYTYHNRTEGEERNGKGEANHPALRAFNAVINILYIALHFLVGFCLSSTAVWVIWRQWRIDRLNGGCLLGGFLLYAIAGVTIWHGFIVTQQLIDIP